MPEPTAESEARPMVDEDIWQGEHDPNELEDLRADLAHVTAERDSTREDLRLADLDVETLQATVARMVTQATEIQAILDQRTAERDSLIERRHEVQCAADARYSEAQRELRDWKRWQKILQEANALLTEPGIVYQSAYVQAMVTDLMAERDRAREERDAMADVVEAARDFWNQSSWCTPDLAAALIRLDAAQQEPADA